MKTSSNPLVKLIARLRMSYADMRGHHGKRWNYEPSNYYLGMRKSKKWQSQTKVSD